MAQSRFETALPHAAEAVDAWHGSTGALARLLPPWQRVSLESRRPGAGGDPLGDGARVVLRMKVGPFTTRWIAEHGARTPGRAFRDVQRSGPFARWEHEHRFDPDGPDACVLRDNIEWVLPWAPVGGIVAGRFVRREIDRMFRFRHFRTASDLARHTDPGTPGRWRIGISGASGMVGQALGAFLEAGGHKVVPLVRGGGGDEGIPWDPKAGTLDPAALEGLHAVVHLAGEPIAGRWTADKKRRIVESRDQATRLLARAMAEAKPAGGPQVLVSASAIGYYGDRGDTPLDEGAPPGEGFLPEVCKAWEAGTDPARDAGVRVVNLRIGVVLDAAGGALAQMLPAFKLGVGGPVGGGDQVMSWIGLDDLIGIAHRAIWDDALEGPVNAVAPNAVTNRQFAKTLGRVLHRPAVLPLPAAVVRALFGEMGQTLLLEGARVVPRRLLDRGHHFVTPDLEEALRLTLGRLDE